MHNAAEDDLSNPGRLVWKPAVPWVPPRRLLAYHKI